MILKTSVKKNKREQRGSRELEIHETKSPLINLSELMSTPIILDAPLARAPSATCANLRCRTLQHFSLFCNKDYFHNVLMRKSKKEKTIYDE